MDKSKLRKDKNESQEGKLFYLEHCWNRNCTQWWHMCWTRWHVCRMWDGGECTSYAGTKPANKCQKFKLSIPFHWLPLTVIHTFPNMRGLSPFSTSISNKFFLCVRFLLLSLVMWFRSVWCCTMTWWCDSGVGRFKKGSRVG